MKSLIAAAVAVLLLACSAAPEAATPVPAPTPVVVNENVFAYSTPDPQGNSVWLYGENYDYTACSPDGSMLVAELRQNDELVMGGCWTLTLSDAGDAIVVYVKYTDVEAPALMEPSLFELGPASE